MRSGSLISHRGEPAVGAYSVTPNDSLDLPTGTTRSLYIGNSGKLKVDMDDGTTATYANVPVGILKISVKRVYATISGNKASNILALY